VPISRKKLRSPVSVTADRSSLHLVALNLHLVARSPHLEVLLKVAQQTQLQQLLVQQAPMFLPEVDFRIIVNPLRYSTLRQAHLPWRQASMKQMHLVSKSTHTKRTRTSDSGHRWKTLTALSTSAQATALAVCSPCLMDTVVVKSPTTAPKECRSKSEKSCKRSPLI